MKKILSLSFFVATVFLFACQNQPKSAEKEVKQAATTGNQLYPSQLQGYWIDAAYLKLLENGTSFCKAQESITAKVTTIEVKDTAAMIGYGFHEGMACAFKETGKTHYEILNVENKNEKAYDLDVVDANTIKVDSVILTKIGTANNGVAVLDFRLVGGTYTLKNGKTNVLLKEDGTVEGLDAFTNYTLLYDYVGEQNPPNQIGFSKGEDNFTYFVFEKKKNGLSIFEYKCIKEDAGYCLKSTKGKLRWELTKVN
jgi:hypothetical protein